MIYSIIKHISIFNEAELRITIVSIQAVSIQQIWLKLQAGNFFRHPSMTIGCQYNTLTVW